MSLEVRLRHRQGAFELDVAFEQPDAGVTALFGPSGAGKTTVLHAVAGLLRPDAGRVRLGDRTLLDSAAGVEVPAHRRRLACVFQDARLFPHLSVQANLLFGHRRSPRPAPPGEIDAVVTLLGIEHLLARRPRSLSGGEKQRVAIGRALLASPHMLLLDEPLAALDPARRDEVMECLERLRDSRGIPMLYVCHRREEIARLADRVVLMDAGRVVDAGPVDAMLAAPGLAGEFGGAPSTIVAASLSRHDDEWGLSVLDSPLGELTMPRLPLAPGAALRIAIRAEDVTLATRPPTHASANNLIEGMVDSLQDLGATWADVQVRCGAQVLVARITRRSAARLELAPGTRVWAQVKATTVQR